GAHLMQRTWQVHAERADASSTINAGTVGAGPATAGTAAAGTPPFSKFAGSSLDPSAERIYGVAILSGVKRQSTSAHFRGGELTAFMGGGQVDLRGATIPPGEEAVLDLFCVMGGFELIVPQNWVIVTPLIPIMGGIDDKRLAPPPGSNDVAGPAAPRPP